VSKLGTISDLSTVIGVAVQASAFNVTAADSLPREASLVFSGVWREHEQFHSAY
jgi:hypothetical protein